MPKFIAIKGCDDPAFILDNLKEGPKVKAPFREIDGKRMMVTNFEGSEQPSDYLGRIDWQTVDGYKCGTFKDEG